MNEELVAAEFNMLPIEELIDEETNKSYSIL